MNIGESARSLREKFGLSQRAAADLLDISFVHLCNIENDKSRPSAEMLEKFRRIYGVDMYVYSWCSSPSIAKLPMAMREATRRMTEVWEKLIEDRKRKFHRRG